MFIHEVKNVSMEYFYFNGMLCCSSKCLVQEILMMEFKTLKTDVVFFLKERSLDHYASKILT